MSRSRGHALYKDQGPVHSQPPFNERATLDAMAYVELDLMRDAIAATVANFDHTSNEALNIQLRTAKGDDDFMSN